MQTGKNIHHYYPQHFVLTEFNYIFQAMKVRLFKMFIFINKLNGIFFSLFLVEAVQALGNKVVEELKNIDPNESMKIF